MKRILFAIGGLGGGGARFLLVPQKDEEAMAAAMERILSDEAFAASLGNEARKLQETLSPEKIYGEWERFILDMAKRKGITKDEI